MSDAKDTAREREPGVPPKSAKPRRPSWFDETLDRVDDYQDPEDTEDPEDPEDSEEEDSHADDEKTT